MPDPIHQPPHGPNLMLDAALDAYDAGLCVVRAKVDGTKAPMGEWKQLQASRPTREQTAAWFADQHPGMGVLCGRVSGGLEMLELEGRAVTDGMWDRYEAACEAAGLGGVLQRIVQGYSEHTPSDGLHLLYRCPTPKGNTKLAQRPDPTVPHGRLALLETRGEGGFVVVAPSHGPTHPTGIDWQQAHGGFTTIATITDAERDALWAVARTFDEMPPPAPVQHIPARPIEAPWRADGESWMDQLCRDLAREPWGVILGRYGWVHHHDAGDVTYWTRPGKDPRDGHSASTNARGTDRLIAFSSSVPLEPWDGTGQAPSYDRLDVIAAYEHHGDRMAAARHLAQRPQGVAWADVPVLGTFTPLPGAVGGQPALNLPDEWWDARPSLQHIRQAAHSRSRSADAVLGVVLARVAAQIPPSVLLPAIVGSTSPLNVAVATVGRSGAGKTSGNAVGRELVPIRLTQVVDNLPIGSGEGLIENYFEMVTEEDAAGKKQKVKRQTKWGMFAYLDEGQTLAQMGGRSGSTIMGNIRSAWSGDIVGQGNASVETRRILPAASYSFSCVVGYQLEYAVSLIEDAAGGTPQRFLWLWAHDATVPDDTPAWPGELTWTAPYTIDGGRRIIPVADDVAQVIRAAGLASTRDQGAAVPKLDSHANLVTLRCAALLAILDGRIEVAWADWELARQLWTVSCAVRTRVLATANEEARRNAHERLTSRIRTETAVAESQEERAVLSGARSIGRRVHRDPGSTCGRRDLHAAVKSAHRQLASLDDMIARAVAEGWVVAVPDGFRPGESRPA